MRISYLAVFVAAIVAAAQTTLAESGPGDEAIVVYNRRLPESKSLAEYYAQHRQVPTNQVFGFDLTTNEDMTRAEFRDGLQRPLAKILVDRKLWKTGSIIIPPTNGQPRRVDLVVSQSKIRYAVLCYGVPLRITEDANLKEENAERLRPEMRRNEAAVDSELVLLPLIEQKLPLAGPLRNPVFGVTNNALLHPTNGVLLVSRLDGPNPLVARGLVDKAMEAETNGLWGRAYFDLRGTTDPGYKIGDDWIRNASEICRRLGFETIVDENPGTFPAGFPMSQIAIYIGWYDEHVSGPLARPKVEFMPGAFAYHLHSFSARSLRTTNQYWVGPLLAKGATISMGCVFEPFLTGTPDVAVFTLRLLYDGFSFGEAAVASQPVLSWQTTIVGDPLYRPFRVSADQLQDSLLQRRNKLVEWYFLRLVNINLAQGKQIADCAAFLEQLSLARQSAVLTEKLGDLYLALGKPSSAVHEYVAALTDDPSPQQRLRLRLVLGERLIALGREPEAYENFQNLLAECPDYPNKAVVYRQLLALAQKLNKSADIEKYSTLLGPENAGPK